LKKVVLLLAGLLLLFISKVALTQDADGVGLIFEAMNVPQDGIVSFTTKLEQETDELYLGGQYLQALQRTRLFLILGLIHNDEVLGAHFYLFSARSLARQGKEREAFTYLALAYPIYEKRQLDRYRFLTLETLVRVTTGLNEWEEAKKYLAELEKLTQNLKGAYQEMYLLHRGVIHFHEGLLQEAKRDWQEAENLREFYPETRGLTLNHLSRVFSLEGNPDKALEYARKALSFSKEKRLRWVELIVYLNLSQLLSESFSKEDEALENLKNAYTIAEAMDLPREKVWILNNQAVIFTQWGEYGEARKVLQEALEIETSHDIPEDVGVLTNLGVLSFYLGDLENAERYLKRAQEEAPVLADRHSEALILANLGMVYKASGKLREAFPYYEKAYHIFEELEAKKELSNLLNSMANLNVMLGELDRAEESLKLASTLSRELSDREGVLQAEVNLGYVKMERKNLSGAQQHFERALQQLEKSNLRSLRFYALLGLGEAELKQGDTEQGRKHLYEAVEIVEKTRNRMEEITDRICFTENRLKVYELLLEELFREGKIEEAFDLSERVKARSFLDVVAGQSVKVKDKDLEVIAKINSWEREKALLEAKKAEVAADPVASWKITEELTQVAKKLDLLYQELQVSSPELLSLVAVSPLPLKAMQKSIPEDVVVLNYFVLPDHTLVWVVTTSTLQGFDLPVGEEVLHEKVVLLRDKLADAHKSDFVPLTDFLCQAIFTPLREHLQGKKKVLCIPHRSLSFVPFQVFTRENRYLIGEYCFFYAPSLNIYSYSLQKEAHPSISFLAFGNPRYPDPNTQPLPGAEEEVKEISRWFRNSRILLGEEATESAFYRLAKEANIIHLSTHGSANERFPLLSTILLAPDDANDGYLLASEVFATPLQADLMVLSACQTALGRYSTTEGLIGFTRSFFYAGVSSLIASLWSVSDLSTKDLFVCFYRYLLGGLPKAEALWRAQMEVANRYGHPYYWAPFILIGKEK